MALTGLIYNTSKENDREQWRRSLAEAGLTLIAGSFEEGATVNSKTDAVWHIAAGQCYSWGGALPKAVPAGSTPESTGGIVEGAWVGVGDAALRGDIQSVRGASVVGTLSGKTVQQHIDKLTEATIYAEDYGIKSDGSDDTDGFMRLSVAVSAMTEDVLTIVFPKNKTAYVGRQNRAPSVTSGYSYRPSYYPERNAYFDISRRRGKTIIEGEGYVLKLNPGMKTGAWNPVTGLPLSTENGFDDVNYRAEPGNLFIAYKSDTIKVKGIKFDGNARSVSWGGRWGDTGWQCLAFGCFLSDNIDATLEDVTADDCALDGIYLSSSRLNSFTHNGVERKVTMIDTVSTNSRRNNLSLTGGFNLVKTRCQFPNAGRFAKGAGEHYSAPEACFDIEPENSIVYNVDAENCVYTGGRYTVLAAALAFPFKGMATFKRCTMSSNSDLPHMYIRHKGHKYIDCEIEGSGYDFDVVNSILHPEIIGGVVRNYITNEAGETVTSGACRWAGKTGNVMGVTYDIILNTGMSSLKPIFQMQCGGVSTGEAYPNQKGMTGVVVYMMGTTDGIPVSSNTGMVHLGHMQWYSGLSVRFTGAPTGANKMTLDTGGSHTDLLGITSETNMVVDRQTLNSEALPYGGFVLRANTRIYSSVLSPAANELTQLGLDTRRFGDLFLGKAAIHLQDSTGGKWRIAVTPTGVLETAKE